MMSDWVFIFDTTLRDGAQTESVSFSIEDKMEIMRRLDAFGVDFVEGGMPCANPKDSEFFERLGKMSFSCTRPVAFGSTCRPDVPAHDDSEILTLCKCSSEWVCIFGKAWDFHVIEALGTTLDENLRMVSDSISQLVSSGKHVIFDAEHFFDGYSSNRAYAMNVITAASNAGAEWIVLCDTNGGSLPEKIGDITRSVAESIDVPLGIHCHNDSDLATACSLAAVDAGARMVQGTVNGIGERCGNANLCSVIPNLVLKKDYSLPNVKLGDITSLSRFVSDTANMGSQPNMPFVGGRAFAHKGGMHVSALCKNPHTYEHIDPATVGNERRILVSDMSGRSSIVRKLETMGIHVTDAESERILEQIKLKESKGYQFESADASFQLLVRRTVDGLRPPYSISGFRLFIDDVDHRLISEASIKVMDEAGNVEHTASDGDGPVNALDKALRKALGRFFPILNDIKLTDYKVRVLDESAATAATVRVLIRSTDGKDDWTTVGVSNNVIEASLIALSDSIEYAILKDGKKLGRQ